MDWSEKQKIAPPQPGEGARAVTMWPFGDAPQRFKDLSTTEGREEWVAFAPPCFDSHWLYWLPEGDNHRTYSVEEIHIDGGTVYIGSHADGAWPHGHPLATVQPAGGTSA